MGNWIRWRVIYILLTYSILVAPMMVDAYRGMSKGFNPSKSDVETYTRILDKNGDGRVTLADLEALAIKYLVGIEAPR